MKPKLLLILFFAGLLVNCNNSNKNENKEVKEPVSASTKSWPAADKKKAVDDCIEGKMNKHGLTKEKATQLCSCIMDKSEIIFSSYAEKEEGYNNKEYQKAIADCETKYPEDETKYSKNMWDRVDTKKKFLKFCIDSKVQRNEFSESAATRICSCITEKAAVSHSPMEDWNKIINNPEMKECIDKNYD